MEPVDYDQKQYDVYAQGRALPAATIAGWIRVFAEHAPARRPLTVLDLGSGTGRFTPALAEEFGGPVHGVEPAERMRAQALRSARHPAVTYQAGAAERIPLPDNSCDLVLMFLVLHHVRDRAAAAVEIARVLRPDGRLLLRTTFADRQPDMLWHRYFPAAREIEQAWFPTLDETLSTFAAAGLAQVALVQSRQEFAPSLAAYVRRLHFRAISVFEYLTEEQLAEGFAALDAALAADPDGGPVWGVGDLLVLGRP